MILPLFIYPGLSCVSLLQNFDQKKSQTTAILFFVVQTDRLDIQAKTDEDIFTHWPQPGHTQPHTQKALTGSGMTQGWPHLFGFTMTMFLPARPHTRGQHWKEKKSTEEENMNMTSFTGYCLLRKFFLTHFSMVPLSVCFLPLSLLSFASFCFWKTY